MVLASAAGGNTGDVCSDEITITISQPDEVVLTATATEVTCFGDADAIITASATGGATITVDGVAYDAATTYGPGTYVVLASAAGGNTGDVCSDEITITISQPDEVVLTATATEVTCFGDADAIITASATGGATITVDGVAYDAATTYGPGTYVVLASAAGGNTGDVCSDEITITISQPDEVVLTATATEVTCFGDADAIITASATGGATITVDGVAYDAATTYGPGTYVVLASAAGGNTGDVCSDEITITISQPDEVVLTATATEVTCFGDADAIITASATGGATITVDGVAYDAATTYGPGTYVVLASAAGGNTGDVCSDEITITISQPDEVVLTATATEVTCFGDADAIITASATGGATITVDGVAYDAATTYGPGTYVVLASAAGGNTGDVCSDEITITISQPDEVVLTATATEVTCFGDADAIITASATGGATITVDGVAYDAATTYGPGTYVVLASAAGGNTGDVCSDEITITISQPDEVVLTATATEVTCFGDADAIITASATGGATITVDGVAYDAATTYGPGTYVVLASAAGGNTGDVCSDEITITISQPDEVVLTATATEVTCFGDADAIITASATGGATITVDGVAYDAATTYGPGTYVVLASAAGGNTGDVCSDEITITISQPDEVVLTATATEVTCFGDADAIITASATGGATITVDGVAYDAATTYGPGTYVVLASAAGGNTGDVCSDEITITISQPDEVVLTATATEVTCFGDADAIITASATGGATITVDGVAYDAATTYGPGTYVVLASAAGGNTGDVCSDEITITISQPDEVVLTATATEVTCFGDADAIITASATGGATITVDGVAYDAATTYGPGTYVVLASAAGGNTGDVCSDEITITISQPDEVVLTATATEVTCFGDADAIITASATGGATITVDGVAYDAATTYGPGTYVVLASAAGGNTGDVCSDEITITISQPDEVVLTATATEVTCFGDADAIITASATGGATITVDGVAYDAATTYGPGTYVVLASAAGGNTGDVCSDEITITYWSA